MTIHQYIKNERLAGRFPSIPIDNAAGRFFLCDGDWKRIDDPKNWFNSWEEAAKFRTKMFDKRVSYVY